MRSQILEQLSRNFIKYFSDFLKTFISYVRHCYRIKKMYIVSSLGRPEFFHCVGGGIKILNIVLIKNDGGVKWVNKFFT